MLPEISKRPTSNLLLSTCNARYRSCGISFPPRRALRRQPSETDGSSLVNPFCLKREKFRFTDDLEFECWVLVLQTKETNDPTIWFKGNEVVSFLGYRRRRQAVFRLVPNQFQKRWSDFTNELPNLPAKWHPDTTFIHEQGLRDLVTRSRKPIAMKMQQWFGKGKDVYPLDRHHLANPVAVEPATRVARRRKRSRNAVLKQTIVRITRDIEFVCWMLIIRKHDGSSELWFRGSDVAALLKYRNSHQAIIRHVRAGWRRRWSDFQNDLPNDFVYLITPKNWQPSTVFVQESGLYALLNRSNKPAALRFQEFVGTELIPAIQRNRFCLNTLRVKRFNPWSVDTNRRNEWLQKRFANLEREEEKFSKRLDEVHRIVNGVLGANSKMLGITDCDRSVEVMGREK